MNIVDIIIIVILIFAAVRGFITGLFSSVASLVAIIAGVFCAIHYSHYVEAEFQDSVLEWSSNTYKIASFAITFLVVILTILFLGKLLTKLADISSLGLLNKILGGIFGALKWSLILSVIFLLFDKFNKTIPFVEKETLEESILYSPVKSIIPTLFPAIMDKENPTLKFD
ncbi:colicin V production protein [Polaribacter vadi]|jgi:membrane protein required for colicin V production|uniref:Colicin V production protein n=1 Tax=Polaribacter vadi TaxID=1774273 RepID=A0A1B8TT24_9FLAO|nr:CvpA family protein [Polaribacter vadi]AOW18042.1 colicin V production protein [Polaribacter vadi]OBY62770.1 colicin V production protein [Polaribacter vadi]